LGESDIGGISRSELVQRLVDGGLWPFLRALPFRDYPRVDAVPPAIYVCLGNLEPFQPDPAVYLEERSPLFIFGVNVLKRLARDPSAVYVSAAAKHLAELGPLVDGTLTHSHTGAYPAHDAGVLVYRLRTSPADNPAWYIDGQDLLLVAEYLTTGHYPTRRVLSVAGARAPAARHVRTRIGAPLSVIVPEVSTVGEVRLVVGGLFTGYTGSRDSYMGLFQTGLTLLPEGNEREFLALVNPGLRKPTYSRAFLSALNPGELEADCNLHGGLRACIACGHCNDVCPVDILPQLTYKAVLADETEEALALGLLDCVECGLCSYVCPSKIDLAAAFKEARAADYRGRD
jgi:Na+-transporting NADH:ubiquinone oxidoreductase subunit A